MVDEPTITDKKEQPESKVTNAEAGDNTTKEVKAEED